MLRRQTLDEALPRLDRYLHDSYMAGLSQVTVIHGKGSGRMRQEVIRLLTHHPLVDSFREGEPAEGGAGVTVVRFSPK